MSSRRVLKAAEAIREVVSMAILTEIRDPRVKDVTVTFVELSADMRNAKVHVSVMGDEKKQNLCLRGLQNSVGFLQSKVGKRIETRYVPRIQFELDRGLKNAMIVTRILDELLPKSAPAKDRDDQPVYDDDDEYNDDDGVELDSPAQSP